eukprot:gene11184-13217_t
MTQMTLCMRSEMFVASKCINHPTLEGSMKDIRREAKQVVTNWEAEHLARVEELHERRPRKMEMRRRGRSLWWQRAWLRLVRFARWLAAAHPLGAIYVVGATEPFSRSERILIQATTFLLMLTFCVWFQYSRAATCCVAVREHLGCPFAADVFEPCLTAPSCPALRNG